MCKGMNCVFENLHGECMVRNRIPSFASCQREDDPMYAPKECGPTVPLWKLEEHLENRKAAGAVTPTA